MSEEVCATCGHDRRDHPLRSCRHPRCPCMRYLVDRGADLALTSIGWQGCTMTGVLELVAHQTEGVVHVQTDDGHECVVKVTFRPLAPFNAPAGGRA